jgi:hypothetical protein
MKGSTERAGTPEPRAFATWGRWCGAGDVLRHVRAALEAPPHCARCDRRPIGLDGDGYAFSLMRGPFRGSLGAWSSGFHLGRPVLSRAEIHVRFRLR